jgi:hypothetical protein
MPIKRTQLSMKTREEIEAELNEVDYGATVSLILAVTLFSTFVAWVVLGFSIWVTIIFVTAFLISSLLAYIAPIKKGDQ